MSCTARNILISALFCLLSSTNLAVASENRLDLDSKFSLSWKIEGSTIQFGARVETIGYVGVGVSQNGTLEGTDICIGGVEDNETYFWDYFGDAGERLIRNDCLMCNLTSVTEINGTTSLEFERSLITDENMYGVNITDREIFLMWVYGDTDDVHMSNRTVGAKQINLLNYEPPHTPTTTATTTITATTPNGCDGKYSSPVSCLCALVLSVFAMFTIFV